MYRDRDFDLGRELPGNAQALSEDLDLETLLGTMALGDKALYLSARVALFTSVSDPESIVYRQDVLRDCLEHSEVARELYKLTVETLEAEKSARFGFFVHSSQYPDSTLHSAVRALEVFAEMLTRLRQIADEHAHEFSSEGFAAFFAMIKTELDDEYLQSVREHLSALARNDVVVSVQLGQGANGVNYVLHRSRSRGLLQRISSLASRSEYVYRIADRDEAGARTLSELRGRALNEVANTAAQSTEHIRGFFHLLRGELAFYISALNLHAHLTAKGEPTCFPTPVAAGQRTLVTKGLYEPCLALRTQGRVVGNDIDGHNKPLIVITGANQGGKSTFLRSAGIAQLMMQCGMFVAAESLTANVCTGVFTHFKREEDASMQSGKLDEELARMSEIADAVAPNSLVLFNESFAATNEAEGSQIARQIIAALLDTGTKVLFVTHMYDLAHGLQVDRATGTLFLRAERQADQTRTFRLLEAEPLPTSYGPDVYRRIFGDAGDGSVRLAAGSLS